MPSAGVVEQHDLHRHAVALERRQLLDVHHDRAVAADADHACARARRAARRSPPAGRSPSCPARRWSGARAVRLNAPVLRHPHLVLADVAGDDRRRRRASRQLLAAGRARRRRRRARRSAQAWLALHRPAMRRARHRCAACRASAGRLVGEVAGHGRRRRRAACRSRRRRRRRWSTLRVRRERRPACRWRGRRSARRRTISRSHSCTAMLAAGLPCMPSMPR